MPFFLLFQDKFLQIFPHLRKNGAQRKMRNENNYFNQQLKSNEGKKNTTKNGKMENICFNC